MMKKLQETPSPAIAGLVQPIPNKCEEQLRQSNELNPKRVSLKTKNKLKLKFLQHKQQYEELQKHFFIGMINHANASLNQSTTPKNGHDFVRFKEMGGSGEIGWKYEGKQHDENGQVKDKEIGLHFVMRHQQQDQCSKYLNLDYNKAEAHQNLPKVPCAHRRSQTEPIQDMIKSQQKHNSSLQKSQHRKYKRLSEVSVQPDNQHIKSRVDLGSKKTHHCSQSSKFETFSKNSTSNEYLDDKDDKSRLQENKKQKSNSPTKVAPLRQSMLKLLSKNNRDTADYIGKIVKNRAYFANQTDMAEKSNKKREDSRYQSSEKGQGEEKQELILQLNQLKESQNNRGHENIMIEDNQQHPVPNSNPQSETVSHQITQEAVPQQTVSNSMQRTASQQAEDTYSTSKFAHEQQNEEPGQQGNQLTKQEDLKCRQSLIPTNQWIEDLSAEEAHYLAVRTIQKLRKHCMT